MFFLLTKLPLVYLLPPNLIQLHVLSGTSPNRDTKLCTVNTMSNQKSPSGVIKCS